METFYSYKKLILKNIFWGKVNTIVRYALAFLATAVLARKFSPEEFGIYQLVISYLSIFEAFYLVNPTHLRNYLAAFPAEEQAVASLWRWQIYALFFAVCVICSVMAIYSIEKLFWILLLITSLKLLFRVNDYVSIVCEQRFLIHIAQKVTLVQNITLNVLRIIVPLIRSNLILVCLTSPLQGLVSAYQQKVIAKRLSIPRAQKVSLEKFLTIFKEGFVMSALSFLSVFQGRIVSLMLAEYLSKEKFGNFQLVLKLVEPATMLGLVIVSANYSVLANTLQENIGIFNKRFLKISALTIAISFVMMGIIFFTPQGLLIGFFGENYRLGISLLKEGSVLVLSNTLFTIDQNYDFLKKEYKLALAKYFLMLVAYSFLIWNYRGKMELETSVRICIYVPLILSLVSLVRRLAKIYFHKKEDTL